MRKFELGEVTDRQKKGLKFVRENEGVTFTNDPLDRGGPTKYGVTEKLARKYGLDVRTLTSEQADWIMIQEFWRWDWLISDRVAIKMFDVSVHRGVKGASVILQLALLRVGYPLTVDGVVGGITKGYANKTSDDLLILAISIEQKNKYCQIVKNDPSQARFLHGWKNRADKEIPS